MDFKDQIRQIGERIAQMKKLDFADLLKIINEIQTGEAVGQSRCDDAFDPLQAVPGQRQEWMPQKDFDKVINSKRYQNIVAERDVRLKNSRGMSKLELMMDTNSYVKYLREAFNMKDARRWLEVVFYLDETNILFCNKRESQKTTLKDISDFVGYSEEAGGIVQAAGRTVIFHDVIETDGNIDRVPIVVFLPLGKTNRFRSSLFPCVEKHPLDDRQEKRIRRSPAANVPPRRFSQEVNGGVLHCVQDVFGPITAGDEIPEDRTANDFEEFAEGVSVAVNEAVEKLVTGFAERFRVGHASPPFSRRCRGLRDVGGACFVCPLQRT